MKTSTTQAEPRAKAMGDRLAPPRETEAHSVQIEARSFPSVADEEQFEQQEFIVSPLDLINDNRLSL
jgi:hypothetical protein